MTEPRSDRPHVPGYGIPETLDGILPWSWAAERLERAIVYWLATTGSDLTPHVIPIWGAWVDGRWYVEGGPTRWQRNLRENPQLAIHIEIGDEVVIVEGTATELTAPAAPLSDRILAGYAKYKAAEDYEASADHWTAGGLWELRPIKAFAWSDFPTDMTRYRF
jgi:nitroimidazol reductase NimA-like FMN-containing flavoprotein (pyridoxamine 5'-phosphate oxidase superfamily)